MVEWNSKSPQTRCQLLRTINDIVEMGIMRSAIGPFVIAAAVTLLIGLGVRLDPFFPGDVSAARAVQSAIPHPEPWALPISSLAPPPARYAVLGLALVASIWMAGWRGLTVALLVILAEQYGAESTKELFRRPRPSSNRSEEHTSELQSH